VAGVARATEPLSARLRLTEKRLQGTDVTVREGTLSVWEDREARKGHRIDLHLVVIPARRDPLPDPVVPLAGGPGQAATSLLRMWSGSPLRDRRDIVLVDQRGTGESNLLQCDLGGTDDDPGSWLGIDLSREAVLSCRKKLERKADLRLYTTPLAMDDLDEVREALGYENLNLWGGSYGTRAALMYMARYPERVRTAVLNGVAPFENTLPLFVPRDAQRSLDLVFDLVEGDATYRKAFPGLREKTDEILERLEKRPVQVKVNHPAGRGKVTILLTRARFSEALRLFLYSQGTARRVPVLLQQCHAGHYTKFLEEALQQQRPLRGMIAFGMLLSIVCSEDVPRIDPDLISETVAGSFMGEERVRRSLDACELWPRNPVPEEYLRPFTCRAPTILLSGSLDPVTPPSWGERAMEHLPNSLHVVTPGYHGIGGAAIDALIRKLIDEASVENLDLGSVQGMELAPFDLPKKA